MWWYIEIGSVLGKDDSDEKFVVIDCNVPQDHYYAEATLITLEDYNRLEGCTIALNELNTIELEYEDSFDYYLIDDTKYIEVEKLYTFN